MPGRNDLAVRKAQKTLATLAKDAEGAVADAQEITSQLAKLRLPHVTESALKRHLGPDHFAALQLVDKRLVKQGVECLKPESFADTLVQIVNLVNDGLVRFVEAQDYLNKLGDKGPDAVRAGWHEQLSIAGCEMEVGLRGYRHLARQSQHQLLDKNQRVPTSVVALANLNVFLKKYNEPQKIQASYEDSSSKGKYFSHPKEDEERQAQRELLAATYAALGKDKLLSFEQKSELTQGLLMSLNDVIALERRHYPPRLGEFITRQLKTLPGYKPQQAVHVKALFCDYLRKNQKRLGADNALCEQIYSGQPSSGPNLRQ